MVLAGIPRSQAAEDDANQILKAMSDYLASQKTISAALLEVAGDARQRSCAHLRAQSRPALAGECDFFNVTER